MILVHQHREGIGKDCGLCYAQQLPGLHDTVENPLATPAMSGSRSATQEPSLESIAFVAAHPGRAPPISLSANFL
jgi:hypothetical protein